jgi:hypothetical protein
LITMRSALRFVSLLLCGILVLVYIAAKVDFFTRYFQLGSGQYLREHSIYWAMSAAILFLIWLIEWLLAHRKD